MSVATHIICPHCNGRIPLAEDSQATLAWCPACKYFLNIKHPEAVLVNERDKPPVDKMLGDIEGAYYGSHHG